MFFKSPFVRLLSILLFSFFPVPHKVFPCRLLSSYAQISLRILHKFLNILSHALLKFYGLSGGFPYPQRTACGRSRRQSLTLHRSYFRLFSQDGSDPSFSGGERLYSGSSETDFSTGPLHRMGRLTVHASVIRTSSANRSSTATFS